ncbi:MAG: hypothetical protein ACREIC_27635 [Limisphaerales bacterium]
MIDLAISVDDDERGVTIVETNQGDHLAAPGWPQDSDFRLVAFNPRANKCDVIAPRELAHDIGVALEALEPILPAAAKKVEWYRRLKKCAAGACDS